MKLNSWKWWMDEWINPALIALVLALLIRTFIVQPFKIPSTSMYPTLKVGDRIFVNKFLYGANVPFLNKRLPKVREPKRGDVMVFISVSDPEYPDPKEDFVRLLGPLFFNKERKTLRWYARRYLVKRLVALPGDRVMIKDGDIFINGDIIETPLVIKSINYFNAGKYGREDVEFTVPQDSYFVLGDNSANSVDSRFWGTVPKDNLTGKVFLIWWPFNRIHILR